MRYNRNVCAPLALERQSVNVLTCEFAHRIWGPVGGHRVPWGEKEGGDEEPDRPGRPTQREQHSQHENNSPTRNTTCGALDQGTTPANTRPNPIANENRNHDLPAKNNPTRTQPARQATRQTSPPHQKRTATHKAPTDKQPAPPNRGTTRTETHSPPSGWGRELRRGLRGTGPHASHHPPGRHRGPPAKHLHPPDTPTPEPNPNQKPDTRTRTPIPPPITPPSTPHRVPCTYAMDHQQPTSTLANKLEQTPQTGSRKSKLQMRRPRPSSHPATYQ